MRITSCGYPRRLFAVRGGYVAGIPQVLDEPPPNASGHSFVTLGRVLFEIFTEARHCNGLSGASRGRLIGSPLLTSFPFPLVEAYRPKMRKELRLYTGGEDDFCSRFNRNPDGSFADFAPPWPDAS
jgi:hypothetical protein